MFWQANYSKLLSLKTKLLRTRWHRTIISMVIGLVLFMGFSQLRITELGNAQASVAEVYPTEIASTSWQGGFFPVENFQYIHLLLATVVIPLLEKSNFTTA